MFHPRPCGCKGQRTCLVCEGCHGAPKATSWAQKEGSYVYCPECDLAWPGWETNIWKHHPKHEGKPVKFPGVKIVQEFVSEEEETDLLSSIDEVPWDPSQSGRRKQNYGPKCNFKKKRVKCDNFCGYPEFTQFIQDRFSSLDLLKTFQTVEQCSLEYTVEKGASIDPHIDDCWIWGERIPTLSLLVDSTLTLRKFNGPLTKYNLVSTQSYPSIVREDGIVKEDQELEKEATQFSQQLNNEATGDQDVEKEASRLQQENNKPSGEAKDNDKVNNDANSSALQETVPTVLRIPMPRRSLLILYGPSRYDWEHGILREDIPSRRVCITYREITPTYLSFGPKAEVGKPILEASKIFWDHRTYYKLDG